MRSITVPCAARPIQLVEQDVRDLFADAGRRLGAGLHVAYLERRTAGPRSPSVTVARAEVCALVHDNETLERLERVAGEEVKELWTKHHSARLALSRERQADYARVNRMAPAPEAETLQLPDKMTVSRGPEQWSKHLFADGKGYFHPSPRLNRWEQLTLEEEMGRKGFRGWLRNPVRKEWSLGVSYEDTGIPAVMYPDFLVFRSVPSGGTIADLLEPHAPNQGDLASKLQGLCKFADRHGGAFGRIELIIAEGRKGREKLLRIDVNDADVRAKAQLLTQNPQVVALARERRGS
jgi:type III restriction enzyme